MQGGQVNGSDKRRKTSWSIFKYQSEFEISLKYPHSFHKDFTLRTRTNMSTTNVSWFERLRLSFVSPALPQMRLGPDKSSQNPVMVSLALRESLASARNRRSDPVLHMGRPPSLHELVETFRKRATPSRAARVHTSLATPAKQSNGWQGHDFFALDMPNVPDSVTAIHRI